MTKKLSMKRAIFAGTAIAAGIAFAGISDDFETEGGSSIWTGGSTQAVTIASAPAGGFPISGENATHTKVFCIDGEASCSNTGTANGKAQLNFLAFITEPSDELPAASSSEMTDVQIAFAAGTTEDEGYVEDSTVALMLYCKAKDGQSGPAWQKTGATLELKKWHHIQLLFDYNNKVCQVCVDGVPLVTELGRLTATDTTTTSGSWYVLANAPDSTTSYLSGLTMYGTAQIDDVVVQEGSSNKFSGDATIGNMAIKYETLAKFGVDETTITQAKLGSSANSLSVAQCLQCGIDPAGTGEFKVESASLASDGKLELVFPGSTDALNGVTPQYRIEWVGLNQADTEPTVTAINGETGKVKATVTIPEGLQNQKVLKYRLKAVAPGTQSNAQ